MMPAKIINMIEGKISDPMVYTLPFIILFRLIAIYLL